MASVCVLPLLCSASDGYLEVLLPHEGLMASVVTHYVMSLQAELSGQARPVVMLVQVAVAGVILSWGQHPQEEDLGPVGPRRK